MLCYCNNKPSQCFIAMLLYVSFNKMTQTDIEPINFILVCVCVWGGGGVCRMTHR